MSILAQSLRRPKIKPKWQAPLGVMESVVAYNCRIRNFPQPVMCLPFWEGAGNKAYDVSGKMNHGTLINGAKWVAGMRSGNALAFDGANDYVNVGKLGNFGSQKGNCYVGMWVYSKGNGAIYTYFGVIDDSTSSQNALVLKINAKADGTLLAGSIRAVITSNEAAIKVLRAGTDANNVPVGVWTHIGVNIIASTNTIQIFVNGVSTPVTYGAQGTPSVFGNQVYDVHIGQLNNAGTFSQFLNGIIDSPHIYNRALTAAQVKYLYDNPYFMYEMPEELWGYAAAAAVWAIRDVIGGGVVPFKR